MAKKEAPSLLDQYKASQVDEWGVYVCGPLPIYLDGDVRAFNPGDAVPASHVTRGVVREDQVIMRDDGAALESLAQVNASPDVDVSALPGATDQPDPEWAAEADRLRAEAEGGGKRS